MGMRFAGVTIYVRDWPRAVKWYTQVLGLEIGPYEEDDQFCMLMSDAGFIGLASDHPEYAAAAGENRLAPSFQVDDFDQVIARLRSLGVKVDDVIDGEGEGYRLTRIWDPEGNRINVFTV